jgi:Zn-dependent protease with chaperone function
MLSALQYFRDMIWALWERAFPQPHKISGYDAYSMKWYKGESARIAKPEKDADVLKLVSEVYTKAGQKPPVKVILYENEYPQVSYFSNNTIAISSGILKTRTHEQVASIVGHELGHAIRSPYSMLINSLFHAGVLAAGFAAGHAVFQWTKNKTRIAWAAAGTAAGIGFEVAEKVLDVPYYFFRKKEELAADKVSAELGYSQGLIENFEMHKKENGVDSQQTVTRKKTWIDRLREPHPPLEDRIARLEEYQSKQVSSPSSKAR